MSKKLTKSDYNFLIGTLKIDDKSLINKFYYILSCKEKKDMMDELGYFGIIYYEVPHKVLFEATLNKFLKKKLYNIQFNIVKEIKDYKDFRKLEEDYKQYCNGDFLEDFQNWKKNKGYK